MAQPPGFSWGTARYAIFEEGPVGRYTLPSLCTLIVSPLCFQGVGKGRTLAALILNHWKEGGKRILWVSCSNDLRVDALRDLGDLGTVASDIPLFPEVHVMVVCRAYLW